MTLSFNLEVRDASSRTLRAATSALLAKRPVSAARAA
jgi:hypothetical protein